MSISKIMTLAASAAALVFIFGDVVENQERKIKGIVVQAPTGPNAVARPVANARVEYMGDNNSTEVQSTTTDSNGRFELPSGTSGIVTASLARLPERRIPAWPNGYRPRIHVSTYVWVRPVQSDRKLCMKLYTAAGIVL